jgi:hypothetical protein
MPSHLPSDAFFLNAIEEIYDKDTSLFIYSKKYSCTSTRGLAWVIQYGAQYGRVKKDGFSNY